MGTGAFAVARGQYRHAGFRAVGSQRGALGQTLKDCIECLEIHRPLTAMPTSKLEGPRIRSTEEMHALILGNPSQVFLRSAEDLDLDYCQRSPKIGQ
jgi:hypothetical protein